MKRITVTKKENYLFNGIDFCKIVCAPDSVDLSVYKEVTEEFKTQWEEEHPQEEMVNSNVLESEGSGEETVEAENDDTTISIGEILSH